MNTILDITKHDDAHQPYTPEHDLYGPVHKGLRFELCALLSRLGQTEPGDRVAVQQVLDDLGGILDMLDSHAGHEHAHVHRALEARQAGAAAHFDRTHERLDQEAAAVRTLVTRYEHVASGDEAPAWRALYLAYSSLVGEHLVHMAEEEIYAQQAVDRLYELEEIQAIHAALLRDIGPEEMRVFLIAMAAGSTPGERARLLAGFRANAPDQVFMDLLSKLLPRLSADQRGALLAAL